MPLRLKRLSYMMSRARTVLETKREVKWTEPHRAPQQERVWTHQLRPDGLQVLLLVMLLLLSGILVTLLLWLMQVTLVLLVVLVVLVVLVLLVLLMWMLVLVLLMWMFVLVVLLLLDGSSASKEWLRMASVIVVAVAVVVVVVDI